MFWIWPELSFFNYVAKNSQLSGGKDTLAIIVSDWTSRSHIEKSHLENVSNFRHALLDLFHVWSRCQGKQLYPVASLLL